MKLQQQFSRVFNLNSTKRQSFTTRRRNEIYDFLIPRQVFRSFPLTESVTRLTSAPLPKQEKREVGLYPEGWGGGDTYDLFCFVLFCLGKQAFNSSTKSSITSHQTMKLDFFMIIYPVIFSMPDISVVEHVDEFKYPAHWLLFQF